jgi:hypothetical protein
MSIIIANRRSKHDNLRKKYGDEINIIDVTSRGLEPWARFSPFYPHCDIPVPFSPGVVGASVEGIWQALKVFETEDVDGSILEVINMKGLKRSGRRLGNVLGHRAGFGGKDLLPYLEARKQIYLPCYKWVLENRLQAEVAELRRQMVSKTVILLDYNTNCDVEDLSRPLSHAGLVKLYIEGGWPD